MALNLNRLSKIASGKKSVLNTEGKILDIELDKIKPDLDFSHYFRWLFANFRECSLIS